MASVVLDPGVGPRITTLTPSSGATVSARVATTQMIPGRLGHSCVAEPIFLLPNVGGISASPRGEHLAHPRGAWIALGLPPQAMLDELEAEARSAKRRSGERARFRLEPPPQGADPFLPFRLSGVNGNLDQRTKMRCPGAPGAALTAHHRGPSLPTFPRRGRALDLRRANYAIKPSTARPAAPRY